MTVTTKKQKTDACLKSDSNDLLGVLNDLVKATIFPYMTVCNIKGEILANFVGVKNKHIEKLGCARYKALEYLEKHT